MFYFEVKKGHLKEGIAKKKILVAISDSNR